MKVREIISHLFSRIQRTVIELTEKIWSLTGAFTLLQSILPKEVTSILTKFFLYRVGSYFNLYSEMKIEELSKSNEYCLNSLYLMAEEYVGNLDSITGARRLCLSDISFSNSDSVRISPEDGEVIWDCFQGVTVWWTMSKTKTFFRERNPVESQILTVRAKNPSRDFFHAYFSHIERSSTNYKKTDNDLIISQNNKQWWSSIRFTHPSTFETLALDPKIKQIILSDLNRFKSNKEFYQRIGRSWKRGYVLYGPPGTGKTSLVAAIAKYMKYDIFELKLSKVKDNSELRQLLGKTWNHSVIVIEDIDWCPNLTQRGGKMERYSENNVSLSGLLNALDGLQSCVAEERIFILTTNNKDMLDSALLRPGRMDLHILLSFCTFPAFKTLAKNYLKVENHELFSSVKERIESGAEMTPAEIIQLMANKEKDPHEALGAVICALDARLNKKEKTLLGKTSTL
ncbi:hypothetical protein SUGI_0499780 [Cryptomeria japonica]|uniref:AAA-ATPase At4g25835-like n=1 Tax=Cryptomeria japonica TaxID=3369 RepID=UPI002408E351|nr:AAA-ATPase At4g25835-like [Cryptomeria japonica]GLJ26048.1 hypothetical protein SUGI_0499780 [Cryptomeria japonica]